MSRLLAADGPKSGFGAIGHVLPSEGPVTELKAGVLRRHGERLKMPLSRPRHRRISSTSADETALMR